MDYPKPLVIPPRALPHKQTFILLHGRGSSGEKFGPALLDSPIASSAGSSPDPPGATIVARTLASAFPHARFVFPTAARRRATVYRRAHTHQWFDNWKLDPPATDREELQLPGLSETTAYLHRLWRDEIAVVPGGAASVVVGGLSQGCAATLVALLLWQGDALGAMVGMCGWLPLATRLNEQLTGIDEAEAEGSSGAQNDEDAFDPFERDDESDATPSDPPTRAIQWLGEELSCFGVSHVPERIGFRNIPIFLGHGTQDDRVSIVLGRESSSCLGGLGVDVCWKEYEDLEHWYSSELLRDMAHFIQTKTGWK